MMTNTKTIRAGLSLEVLTPNSIPLEVKIMEFKEDPERMDELRLVIDDILASAQKQVELKVIDKKALLRKNSKGKDNLFIYMQGRSLLYGIKRGRIITRARSAVVRIFEGINVLTHHWLN